MAFDPSQFGATPVDTPKTNTFNPTDFGAVAIESPSKIEQAPHSFLGGIVRGALNLPARVATSLVQAKQVIKGEPLSEPFSGSYLGRVQPLGADPNASVAQGTITATPKQLLKGGVGGGLETGSYLVGGEGTGQVLKSGVQGLLKQGFIQGAKSGAIAGALQGTGSSLENQDSTVNALKSGVEGGLTGGVVGGVLGSGSALIGKAADLYKNGNIEQASNIMNRVARLTPNDANKFQEIAGMSHGEYLAKSGNFGTPEKIIENESKKFVNSLDQVDSAIEKLPGVYHSDPVDSALSELHARESVVSTPGAPSPDKAMIDSLVKANEKDGLTMKQINQVKRIYERNIKLQYAKDFTGQTSEKLARATNIDNAMRNWQFNQAEQLGLKNLPDLNKQTQISKFIINKLGKQITGKTGNDAIGLTDWIMLSHGNPQAIAGFLTKKTFSSKAVQSDIAERLAGSPTIKAIESHLVPTAENAFRKVSPTGAKLLPAPAEGAPKISIPSGQTLRVAPQGINAEMTSKTGIIPSKPAKLLK